MNEPIAELIYHEDEEYQNYLHRLDVIDAICDACFWHESGTQIDLKRTGWQLGKVSTFCAQHSRGGY